MVDESGFPIAVLDSEMIHAKPAIVASPEIDMLTGSFRSSPPSLSVLTKGHKWTKDMTQKEIDETDRSSKEWYNEKMALWKSKLLSDHFMERLKALECPIVMEEDELPNERMVQMHCFFKF